MRAFVSRHPDSPSEIAEIAPAPAPDSDEICLEVVSCGLNFADLLLAKGQYQDRRPHPVVLGMEVSGRVVACGADVTGLAPGDAVLAFSGHSGLAERITLKADRCLPLPDGVDFDTAAAFQVAYGTSHMALEYKAALKPEQKLLVLGAAGGVGLTAVEIGKLMGAHVTAVARGPEKLAIAEAAGADALIDGSVPDLKAALKAAGPFDVVYDPVAGDGFRAALSACAPEARYLLIGFAGGLPDIPGNHLLVKNVSVIGFWWGGHLGFNPKPLTDSLATLLDWLVEGRVTPHISHRLPLEQAAEGLALLRDRKATGKVVIQLRPQT